MTQSKTLKEKIKFKKKNKFLTIITISSIDDNTIEYFTIVNQKCMK